MFKRFKNYTCRIYREIMLGCLCIVCVWARTISHKWHFGLMYNERKKGINTETPFLTGCNEHITFFFAHFCLPFLFIFWFGEKSKYKSDSRKKNPAQNTRAKLQTKQTQISGNLECCSKLYRNVIESRLFSLCCWTFFFLLSLNFNALNQELEK